MRYLGRNVAVIGAGSIGAACAFYLSRIDGLKVTLVDRGHVAGQNTSLAASLYTQARSKSHHIPLVLETYRAIELLEAQLQEKLGVRKLGTVHIVSDPSTEQSLEKLLSNSKEFGIAHRPASNEELQAWFPWLNTEKVARAVFFPDDLYVDSVVLTQAYVEAAKRNGVTVRFNTEVREIAVHEGMISGLVTDTGPIGCNTVVDAAGAWSNLIASPVGFQLPMAPVRSIYWITEQNLKLFPSDQPVCIIPEAKTYTRPENGALLFGIRDSRGVSVNPKHLPRSVHELKLIDDAESFDIIEDEGSNLASFFPELWSTGIKQAVSGLSTYSVDGEFIIGESDSVAGLFSATGCSGAGVAASGGIARLIAEMIHEEPLFTDASAFNPNRRPDADVFSDEFVNECALMRSGKRDG